MKKKKTNFLSFNDARRVVILESEKHGINSLKTWREYCKSGNKPKNIPSHPHLAYRNKGWISLGHWLNTGNTRGCCKKYHINEHFFKSWSSNMAYILGFFWADGCIRNNKRGSKTFSITQHKDDKYILEKILQIMESNHPITPLRNCFEFTIGSKEIFDDIVKLGGKTNKSMDINFPHVPREYLQDFIRGYFDGDGSVYKKGYGIQCNFVSGSFELLNGLNEVLKREIDCCGKIKTIPERWTWINGKYCRFRQNYRLTLYENSTRRLRDFIYQNPNCIKIERKYEKFLLAGAGKVKCDKNNMGVT